MKLLITYVYKIVISMRLEARGWGGDSPISYIKVLKMFRFDLSLKLTIFMRQITLHNGISHNNHAMLRDVAMNNVS